ncbi:MAG TPA: peptidylprolyl isomerase [Gemmataceae bacterium]|nr:peptidylprolyl isomerase [Gemmataceae bacterium]
MARSKNWRIWAVGGSMILAALLGCTGGDKKGQVEAASKEKATPVTSIPNGDAAAPTPSDPPSPGIYADAKMNLPFEHACITEINADAGFSLPPVRTTAGLSTGNLNDAVHKLWDQIKFVGPDGKPQTYVLELEVTSGDQPLGNIEILMQPELAPNHVRNFVALTMLEYYDGLHIDRIVKQAYETEKGSGKLVLLEAGMPTQEFDPPSSHLGYWLKPEFSQQVKHEEGTVGACLLETDDNEETAAVRFYINLTPAPAMDGNFTIFGKVVKGLDVAKKIAEQTVRAADAGPDQGRPVQAITIKKVTVRAVPVQ